MTKYISETIIPDVRCLLWIVMFLLLTEVLFCCSVNDPIRIPGLVGLFVVFFVDTISDESSQIALEVIITKKKMAMPIWFVTMTKGVSSCNNIKFDRVFSCCQACEMPKFLIALVPIVVVPLHCLIRTARPFKFLLLHFDDEWLLECATAWCEIHDNRVCCRACEWIQLGTYFAFVFSTKLGFLFCFCTCSLVANAFHTLPVSRFFCTDSYHA